MIDPARVAEIVNDPRLTPDAVRLVLHVATRGAGPVEVDADELRLLLGCKSDRPVYNARERAARSGYLRWQQGGRAHANVYEYIGHRYEVNALPRTQVRGKGAVVEDDDVDPPISPLHPLAPEAERAIEQHGKTLAGCRDSLRDYLRRRVVPPRQSAFVHDVAAKVNGMGFNWHGTAMADRPGLVAGALNELAASDEQAEFSSPPGSPRNFRTKLGILVTKGFRGHGQATGTDGRRGGKRDQPSDTQDYGEGTTEYQGLNH